MAYMAAGNLNRRVVIQEPSTSKDRVGAVKKNWTNWKTGIAAEFTDKRGREYWNAKKVNAEITDVIRVRQKSVAGIKPDMRVVYGSRNMLIVAVLPDDKHHDMLQLMVREDAD